MDRPGTSASTLVSLVSIPASPSSGCGCAEGCVPLASVLLAVVVVAAVAAAAVAAAAAVVVVAVAGDPLGVRPCRPGGAVPAWRCGGWRCRWAAPRDRLVRRSAAPSGTGCGRMDAA